MSIGVLLRGFIGDMMNFGDVILRTLFPSFMAIQACTAVLATRSAVGIPLPFNRVVLFLITLLQITIICLGNYITPNQTMPHGELNTQRLLKGHTVKSSPPHIYILIYNGHQISLV
jgi:ABC-type transport system involved in cytochrome bd biosynthesis fused ATPase/permease subunit